MTSATSAVTPTLESARLGLRDGLLVRALLLVARLVQLAPDGLVYRAAAAAGSLAWLLMPARRALVRDNLERVCRHLAATQQASPRIRAAARSPRELDRLVRGAFQHWARSYAESAVAPRYSADDLRSRVVLETPETAREALGAAAPGEQGRIFVGFHFGSVELAALYAARTGAVPVSGPMETVKNPALRAYFERTRGKLGIDLLPLAGAADALTARLGRGEAVALVADRQIRGAGSRVTLFGAPARLPLGPAALAAESGAKAYVVGMWRTSWGRWSARLDRIELSADESRRERLRSALEQEARLLEAMVARAPEQWWSLFFRIWDAD